MNTSNNRRRRESVERIERAFMDMVQTCTLREITGGALQAVRAEQKHLLCQLHRHI